MQRLLRGKAVAGPFPVAESHRFDPGHESIPEKQGAHLPMKAVYIEAHGGPEVLTYGERPEPEHGANEAEEERRGGGD